MNKEQVPNKGSSLLKSVMEDSRKIRAERGHDFYSSRRPVEEDTSKIHSSDTKETDLKKLRDSHFKLAGLLVEYDKKIFDQNTQVSKSQKSRSKSVHLYIDEKIEHFLNAESKKSETKWGLRKNAGLGSLIKKFIENFIELKYREERQLVKVKKIIDDFRSNLIEFKKYSTNTDDYQNAEKANQKMKVLSNDLRILLSLLEFKDGPLKSCLGADQYNWVDLIIKWKFYS
jgi:hypothetical protein